MAKQVGSFKVLVIAPHGYVKASMPDLLRSVDNAPQFKDVFREIMAMKDFLSKLRCSEKDKSLENVPLHHLPFQPDLFINPLFVNFSTAI